MPLNKFKILKLAKGFRNRSKNCVNISRRVVERSLVYTYRDRRDRKRDFRTLWIQRINAGKIYHYNRTNSNSLTKINIYNNISHI